MVGWIALILYIIGALTVPMMIIKISNNDVWWSSPKRTKLDGDGWMLLTLGALFWPVVLLAALIVGLIHLWLRRVLPLIQRHIPSFSLARFYSWLRTPNFRREVEENTTITLE